MISSAEAPACSVLIPSRKRFPRLLSCVQTLVASATGTDYEIVIRLHRDDLGSIVGIPLLLRQGNVRIAIGNPMGGYDDLCHFYEEAADLSRGHWLWMMTDDSVVVGRGWDHQIATLPAECYAQPEVYQLNTSRYPLCEMTPYFVIPRHSPGRPFKSPIDAHLHQVLRVEKQWPCHFLSGIVVMHDQDTPDVLAAYHRT